MSELIDTSGRFASALASRYRIEREIGQGGTATVWLAHDVRHDRRVAIKILHPDLAAVLGAQRFLAEIKVTANLQHPHILPLYDSGESDGQLFFVMPYVDGESLRARLDREKQLPVEEAVRIAREAALALDYAHRHGVIHRDVKPGNILLQDGWVLVADFGIALAVSRAGGARLTQTGISLGTPHYMSPEQAAGERDLTPRADIYALGAALYEMLTGETPFTGPTAQAVIAKTVSHTPRPIPTLRKVVSPALDAAVRKALEKVPADRYGSASEFADALGTVLSQTGPRVSTGVKTTAPVIVPFLTRLGWKIAAVLIGIAGVVGWLVRSNPVSRGLVMFELPLPPLVDHVGSRLALTPDGRALVYVTPGDRGWPQLAIRRLDKREAQPVDGTMGAFSPFVSPDGMTLGYWTTTGLSVVPLLGGNPRTLSRESDSYPGAWGPRGLYYGSLDGRIWVVPQTDKTPEPVSVIDSSDNPLAILRFPHVLPNGKSALVTLSRRGRTNQEHELAILSLTDGQVRHLGLRGSTPKFVDPGYVVFVRDGGRLFAAPFDASSGRIRGREFSLGAEVATDDNGFADYCISKDGTLTYLQETDRGRQLVWVDRAGREQTVAPGWVRDFDAVALSPDGKRIAASLVQGDRSDVWVYDLEDSTSTRLTLDGQLNHRPAWHPGGSRLAFVSDREGKRDLFVTAADGRGGITRLVRTEGDPQELSWSGDGKWIAYRTGSDDSKTRRDILAATVVPAVAPLAILASPFDELNPAIAPNGNWIAYVSDESGKDEVYVRPFPQISNGRWQISTNGGTEPLWAPNGQELFYRSSDGLLVAAGIETKIGFRVRNRSPLFSLDRYVAIRNHTAYGVSADGQRFLMIRRPLANDLAVVILNWGEHLAKQRPRP